MTATLLSHICDASLCNLIKGIKATKAKRNGQFSLTKAEVMKAITMETELEMKPSVYPLYQIEYKDCLIEAMT